jgi:flagellar basal-body rod protein FlgC
MSKKTEEMSKKTEEMSKKTKETEKIEKVEKISKKIIIILFITLITSFLLEYSCYANSDSLRASIEISVAGMEAQLERIKIVSQNIANINTTGSSPGSDPYRRKVIIFKNQYDPKINAEKLVVDKIEQDKSNFIEIYQPEHPAADPITGKVKLPNVDSLIETMDAKETQRSLEANVQLIEIVKNEQKKIMELLK